MRARIRLHTGVYRCPRCGTEYDCVRLEADDLACDDCGARLSWVNPIQVWVRRYPHSLRIRKQRTGVRQ
jgi:DNA-directed RNA polymerase subunit RPC12/RpoP